jgi:putative Mn2+ efflux pump MntP
LLPVWIIMALFLLRGEGGVRKALAFAAGAMTVRLVQGVLFGYVFGTAADAYGESGSNLITSTLLLVLGILMLISAAKKWRKEEEPDVPPPKWMATLGGLSAIRAFGIGTLLMALSIKQWVFTLSAIAVIAQGELSLAGSALTYFFFVLAAQSLVLAPILVSAVAPVQAAMLLDPIQGWLERNNRAIVIAASSIFGVWFLWKGIAGLIG